jgi:excisionase family DNA binding protein
VSKLEAKADVGSPKRKQPIDPQAVYSRQEAAEALGVSLSTLKKLISAGHLRVSQPKGVRRIFIKGESILAMLDQTVLEKRA